MQPLGGAATAFLVASLAISSLAASATTPRGASGGRGRGHGGHGDHGHGISSSDRPQNEFNSTTNYGKNGTMSIGPGSWSFASCYAPPEEQSEREVLNGTRFEVPLAWNDMNGQGNRIATRLCLGWCQSRRWVFAGLGHTEQGDAECFCGNVLAADELREVDAEEDGRCFGIEGELGVWVLDEETGGGRQKGPPRRAGGKGPGRGPGRGGRRKSQRDLTKR